MLIRRLTRGLGKSGFIGKTKCSTCLDASNVRKVMTRILKNARLPLHFTPHCLRHTYASLMLQQGEPVAYIQRQLGHASIQLTVDTYGKWLPLGNQAAVDRLDDPISQSGSRIVAKQGSDAAKLWSWREELNLQPVVYKTTALPLSYASQVLRWACQSTMECRPAAKT